MAPIQAGQKGKESAFLQPWMLFFPLSPRGIKSSVLKLAPNRYNTRIRNDFGRAFVLN